MHLSQLGTTRWLLASLLFVAGQALGQSELACKAVAVYVESRGEPVRASKAVLQVLQNRMHIDNQTACQVVKRKGAFPWARKKNNWKITNDMLTRYFDAYKMLPVVNIDAYYFNDKPVKWGVPHKRVGNLWFNTKEKS